MRPAPIDPETTYAHLRNKVNWAVCDKCGFEWPEKMLNFRDGLKVCPNHSTYRESSTMVDTRYAKNQSRIGRQKEPQSKWPHPSEMRDVAGLESVTPWPVALKLGGAAKNLVMKGRNIAVTSTLAASHLTITFSAINPPTAIDPETYGNQWTINVSAKSAGAGGVAGNYDFLFNGDVFKNVFEVRA